jgi:hypothetical protein
MTIKEMLANSTWTAIPWETRELPDGDSYSTYYTVLDLNGFKMRVWQLKNGKRVLDEFDVVKFIDLVLATREDAIPTTDHDDHPDPGARAV